MPFGRLIPGKALIVLAAVLLLWGLLPTLFRSGLRDLLFEFQAPSWAALSHLRDLNHYWFMRSASKDKLIEAGRDLARLNAAYEVRLQQVAGIDLELERLERLLNLPSLPEYRYEIARVARRDMNVWWQHLLLRKGSADGLRPGQGVIFVGGVVGRIKEVHQYTAVVELITSTSFRAAAHLEGDPRPVTYQGGDNRAFRAPRGRVFNVPLDVGAGPGGSVRLVSSRLGGVFPDGLTIGYAEGLQASPDGLFQTGSVRLDDRLLGVREVAVLVPLDPVLESETHWGGAP